MLQLAAKHPLPIRISHWVNVPVLSIMVWSGLLIYWSYDPYAIRLGTIAIFKFFPDWFYFYCIFHSLRRFFNGGSSLSAWKR